MEVSRIEFDALMARIAQLESRCAELEKENAMLRKRNTELERRCQILEEENLLLREENIHLKEENARLKEEIVRLKRNSTTSSKPPSSDGPGPKTGTIRPKNRKGKKKGKPGAKPGHKKNERPPIVNIDQYEFFDLGSCPECGSELIPASDRKNQVVQQIEIVENPVIVAEYEAGVYWCEKCQSYHRAKMPDSVERGGLFGPG